MERGLPANLEAERFILGAILLDDSRFSELGSLGPEDFSLERHQRIYRHMQDLQARGEHIDCITVGGMKWKPTV